MKNTAKLSLKWKVRARHLVHKVRTDSEFVEDAYSEIVSPVRAGKMKWRGFYNTKPISFNLLDSDLKNSVLNREVSFQHGNDDKMFVGI